MCAGGIVLLTCEWPDEGSVVALASFAETTSVVMVGRSVEMKKREQSMTAQQPRRAYWFKRRRYGWGWYPVTWQGWAAIAVYMVVVIATALLAPTLGMPMLALATTILVWVSARMGPPPRWRWGPGPDDDPDLDA